MKRAPYNYAPETSGKNHWRSLGELNGSAGFKSALSREFPEGASDAPTGIERRRFITLMGASLALSGLVGCRCPEEKIVPYTRAPEEVVPGNPLYFATARPFYRDDFAQNRADEWHAVGGAWRLAAGAMHNDSDERGAKMLTGSYRWRDYRLQADVQLLGEGGDAGVVLRSND